MIKSNKSQGKIRTRFAPSPTGYLHIGGVRTALFNYLFSKQNKGDFILRIEDTDRERLVTDSMEDIISVLEWLKIKYDEKPYVQSERLEIYKNQAEELIKNGNAYYCFCDSERLVELRKEQTAKKLPPMYDGKCRNLTLKEVEVKIVKDEKFVIRLKIPKEGVVEFNDMVRGSVKFENKLLDDSVLLKSDGFPTYHLANVVDDHLMKITDVIRAEEWLPSAPKHILIYNAFNWDVPRFTHLPLILGSDRSKLSKRHGSASARDFRAQGYLPEAIINFIALLGWAPSDNREIFSMKELIKEFSLERIQKGGAVFNIDKLNWINGQYIRKKSSKELLKLILEGDFLKFPISNIKFPKNYLEKIIKLEQPRLVKLSEITEKTDYFFSAPEYDKELLKWKNMGDNEIKESLEKAAYIVGKIPELKFRLKNIEKIFLKEAEATGDRGRLLWPLRVALSGKKASPGPFEIADVLGKEETVRRLKNAVFKLG